jgi:hypothetical protein
MLNNKRSESVDLDYDKRIKAAIEDYRDKGYKQSNRHVGLQVSTFVLGAMIPVLTVVPFGNFQVIYQILAAIFGGAIAVMAGIMQLKRYLEAYIVYRTGEKLLETEKILYKYSAGDYQKYKDNPEESRAQYVKRSEDIIKNTNEERLERYDKGDRDWENKIKSLEDRLNEIKALLTSAHKEGQ